MQNSKFNNKVNSMCKTDIDNIIFFPHKLDIRAGGPSGYIANLQKRIADSDNIKIISQEKFYTDSFQILKFFIKFIPFKKYRKKLRLRINLAKMFSKRLPLFFYLKLRHYHFKTIICHRVWDVPMVKNYVAKHNPTAKVLLMSHSPQAPSDEYWEASDEELKKHTSLNDIKKFEKEAFEQADSFVFPSPEATEPYALSVSYFEELKKNKSFYYIPTGANRIEINKNKEQLRTQYNISTPYIISYLGRHNEIKGYDLLKIIAQKVLAERDDVTFLIAGNPSPDILPLEHPKWIEVGRTHPSNILSIADLFILPNRQTYFDLVLLEVLSAGVPVLASNTGGNKSVYNQTKAIQLYNTTDDCVRLIQDFFKLSKEKRSELSEVCLRAYLDNYTPELFAENYKNLIKKIIKDMEKSS